MARALKYISIMNNTEDVNLKVKHAVKCMGAPDVIIRDQVICNQYDQNPERIMGLEGTETYLPRIIDGLSSFGAKELTIEEAVALANEINANHVEFIGDSKIVYSEWAESIEEGTGFSVLSRTYTITRNQTKDEIKQYCISQICSWAALTDDQKSLFDSEDHFDASVLEYIMDGGAVNSGLISPSRLLDGTYDLEGYRILAYGLLSAAAKSVLYSDEVSNFVSQVRAILLLKADWTMLTMKEQAFFANEAEFNSLK